jgi:hypothetical protein
MVRTRLLSRERSISTVKLAARAFTMAVLSDPDIPLISLSAEYLYHICLPPGRPGVDMSSVKAEIVCEWCGRAPVPDAKPCSTADTTERAMIASTNPDETCRREALKRIGHRPRGA